MLGKSQKPRGLEELRDFRNQADWSCSSRSPLTCSRLSGVRSTDWFDGCDYTTLARERPLTLPANRMVS